MSEWQRTCFSSVWPGPLLELIVVQNPRSEGWQWTAQGWRGPDDGDGADKQGWVFAPTQQIAEERAIQWYLAKE